MGITRPGRCRAIFRGSTSARSTSAATDLWRRLIETTTLQAFFTTARIPSTPRRGPSEIVTLSPHFKYGHGSAETAEFTIFQTASISPSGTGLGTLPAPTIEITPGVVNTGRRTSGSNRQNKYPGNSG